MQFELSFNRSQYLVAMKTPFYQYDLSLLHETLAVAKKEAAKHGYIIHYAIKANANPTLLRVISSAGFGADCVSGNEIKAALENGFKPHEIVFAGVGKTDDEIKLAIQKGIYCIHCESVQELEVIDRIAHHHKRRARIALRINPNVSANTHKSITTGLKQNKFGLTPDEAKSVLINESKYKNVEIIGMHFHIGSQILDMDVFKHLALAVNRIQEKLGTQNLPYLNVGGGLGINYQNPESHPIPDFKAYFRTFRDWLKIGDIQKVHFELGRSLVGQCGQLITSVLYTKGNADKRFVVVDAGINALIRPALYGAVHRIVNLKKPELPEIHVYDVVGPICETTDCLGEQVLLPETERGDLLAIHSCGAYAESMASDYNLRERPQCVFINNALAY